MPLGDSNKIVTGFSSQLGIMKMVVYGLRKSPNRYGADFELLNTCEVVLTKSKRSTSDLLTLKEHQLIQSAHACRENTAYLMFWYYLVEFLYPFLNNIHEPEPIYRLLNIAIHDTKPLNHDGYALIRGIQIQLLDILGYLPPLDQCSSCHTALTIPPIWVTYNPGWFRCNACAEKQNDYPLEKIHHATLIRLHQEPNTTLVSLMISPEERAHLNIVFNRITYSILGKRLKTETLLKPV
jgi:DNA repair protein RecO